MSFNPNVHQRHSIRLQDYDYSQAGAYFVTICAWQRECLFGEIINGEMALNTIGRIVESTWCNLPEFFKNTSLDQYVIMPNHFHGIVNITESAVAPGVGTMVGAKHGSIVLRPMGASPASPNCPNVTIKKGEAQKAVLSPLPPLPGNGTAPGSFGSIVQNFKSVSTRKINKFRSSPGSPVWQRNYYERVIRNEEELSRAREYIANNPMKWVLDKENPANYR